MCPIFFCEGLFRKPLCVAAFAAEGFGGAAAGEFVQMDLRQRLAVLRVPLLREELVFHRKAGNQQDRGLGVFCADDVEES